MRSPTSYDPVQIAMAAVKLYHQTTVGDGGRRGEIGSGARARTARAARRGRAASSSRFAGSGDMARIFIGAGREAGIRPQDLVGAIANEAGVAGRLASAPSRSPTASRSWRCPRSPPSR